MGYPISTFLGLTLKDFFSPASHITEKAEHYRAAVKWLMLAHDKEGKQGVSYGYSLAGGWRPPYRETSGYIAVTFFNLAVLENEPSYRERALAMCDWELTVQNEDGSIANPHVAGQSGIVFDTGQVLFGLVRAFEETQEEKYRVAAERAARWLIEVSDEQGRWTRSTHNGIPHVYNSRVAWALLRFKQSGANPSLEFEAERVARANLDFAVENLRSGWFTQCAFETDVAPFTHTIAYAIRGLFESGVLLKDERYIQTAMTVADSCIDVMDDDGFLAGQIDVDGKQVRAYCCLTGNCQLAIVWAKLFKMTANHVYRDAAVSALRYVMGKQNIRTTNKNINGAIAGSSPIWGRYSRLTFPNWPTKFFVDALIECWDWL